MAGSNIINVLVRVEYSLDNGKTWAIAPASGIDLPWSGPAPDVGGPPTAVTAEIGPTSVSLKWADPETGPPASYLYGWIDATTEWEGPLPATAHAAILDKLTPGKTYRVHVSAVTATGARSTWEQSVAIPAAPADPPVVVTPSSGMTIGAFVDHDLATAQGMAKWLGLPHLGNVCCFVTRKTAETVAAGEWMKSVPAGAELVLSVPLIPEDGTSLGADLTTMFQSVARQAASIQANAVIRLGWEMNLPQWAWRVTDANLAAWRAAWTRAYDAMKTVAPHLRIIFNGNGGGDQSGLSGGINRAIVAGKVDGVGTDQYDAWPPMISAAGISAQLSRYGGLDWWASLARSLRVPLWLPEIGVSSGTQWAGHCGGDNPAYVTQIDAFRKKNADIIAGICWFNEPKDYVRSDIYRLSGSPSNPKAAAEWKRLFGA